MEKSSRGTDIVLLFDNYSVASSDLHESFKNAGYDVPTIVIGDDGFLPDDVVNVFEYFLGDDFKNNHEKPRFFNQLPVPKFWEITGTNSEGTVHNREQERARIFYAEPKNKRYIKVVDWLDEKGNVRCSDHYNKCGRLYARTTFNKISQKVNKTYFDVDGKEKIVENFVTGDIILNGDDGIHFFENKTAFVTYFMQKLGYDKKRVFFNSLSVPFFVSNALKPNGTKSDILFWQEPIGNAIPGNMQFIINNKSGRCGKIIVQNHPAYEKLLGLGVHRSKISELGFIYSFKKKNLNRPQALICTNTENVEKLAELLKALPEVTFHVVALTEMSAKLLSHEKYPNARMYPNAKMAKIERLFIECDYFLDINHDGEIVDATRTAFLHNQLILAFRETSHGKEYTKVTNCYASKDYMRMVERIKVCLNDKKTLDDAISSQQKFALNAKESDYIF